jgi:hypothetical protein
MVRQLYKTIINKEIPQLPERNPMFKKEVGFSDKVYRNFIKKMNKETRTIRRKSK